MENNINKALISLLFFIRFYDYTIIIQGNNSVSLRLFKKSTWLDLEFYKS